MYQSLESIRGNLEALLHSNANRSLSGVFKALRRQPKIDLIGDYLLLSYIIKYSYYRLPQIIWSRTQILHAVRISAFYLDEDRKDAYIPKEWEKYVSN